MKGFKYIVLVVCTLTVSMARAQYYSINIDVKTAAAMVSAYATETVAETYYNEQLSKIREHYQAAEVAAAGIFAAKYLDRKALTDLGLWTSSTENYYYRRIYHMVSAKIMPKIWTVAGMMLKSPQNALYWGTYLMKVCEDTKNLCYQFESIVTNSRLTFSDIAFLEISQDIADILKLSEYDKCFIAGHKDIGYGIPERGIGLGPGLHIQIFDRIDDEETQYQRGDRKSEHLSQQ